MNRRHDEWDGWSGLAEEERRSAGRRGVVGEPFGGDAARDAGRTVRYGNSSRAERGHRQGAARLTDQAADRARGAIVRSMMWLRLEVTRETDRTAVDRYDRERVGDRSAFAGVVRALDPGEADLRDERDQREPKSERRE